jgi:hypothetical protein
MPREWKAPGWSVWATHTGTLYVRECLELEQVVDASAVFDALCNPAIHQTDGGGRFVIWWPYWCRA